MTTAFWCLLIACLIPIVTAWVCGYFRFQQLGSVDNKHPRAQYSQLQGAGARAVAAQQNAWEALPIFACGVLVAHIAGAPQAKVDMVAMIFIAARLLYPVFYIANLDALRSLSFIAGLAASIYLFVLAA